MMYLRFLTISLLFASVMCKPKNLMKGLKKEKEKKEEVVEVVEVIPPDWVDRVKNNLAFYSPDDNFEKNSKKYMPLLGNGYLSNDIGVKGESMYVGGVFNGETTSPSHRARIPSTFSISVVHDDMPNGTLPNGTLLDVDQAIYYRRGTSIGCSYELRWYAHRALRNLYVMELDVTVLEGFEGCTLNLESNCGEDSPDIVFKDMKTTVEGVRAMCGRTKTPETKNGPKPMVCMAYTEVPEAVEFAIEDNGDANRLTFITSISTSLDDAARQEREDILQYTIGALNHGLQLAESKQLRELHIAEWAKLWTRGVTAQNHSDLNGAIKSSLYAILSSVRPDWPFGLAPGGLTNVFNGHSFWDTEIWMYPPLLMLYPDIAESLLLYRFQRLEGAKIKAKSYDPPYEGFMFPWESAFSGVETCPLWAASGIREQHISSDISHAVWQYWLMQRDEDWLRNVGLKILVGVADFYVSRVTFVSETEAHINNVVPPDEYVDMVNNSVYTNFGAAMALRYAVMACQHLGLPYREEYLKVADAIVIPFDETKGIHPEYDTYNGTGSIKQADVILLHYPLGMPMPEKVRIADLDFYATKADEDGPAMTWSMHAIGYRDSLLMEETAKYFNRSYVQFVRKPFNVWTERRGTGGSAKNFITGAGGFLQALINGYGGFRLNFGYLEFSPMCAEKSRAMTFRRIAYLGAFLDFHYTCENNFFKAYPTNVTITQVSEGKHSLAVDASHNVAERKSLEIGVGLKYVLVPSAAYKRNEAYKFFIFAPDLRPVDDSIVRKLNDGILEVEVPSNI